MIQENDRKPHYGNWVSRKIILVVGTLTLVFSILSFWTKWFIPLALFFFFWSVYFSLARWFFSQGGRNIQGKVQNLVLNQLQWAGKGKLLDIGCGSGSLSISIAKAFPDAEIVGIDSWGKNWEFGRSECERNAGIEGVADQIKFQQAGAAHIPFNDREFDVVVSNLVFHEVQTEKNKRLLIEEALRVLKTGGIFIFQDLFLWKSVYGEIDSLLGFMKKQGLAQVSLVRTNEKRFVPGFLKLPFMLGTLALIHGIK